MRKNKTLSSRARRTLPDSAYLLPKYRKLPYKTRDASGRLRVSVTHLRNALARVNQVEDVPIRELKAAAAKAQRLLAQHGGYEKSAPTPLAPNFLRRKRVTLENMRSTPEWEGHFSYFYNWEGMSSEKAERLADALVKKEHGLTPNFFRGKKTPEQRALEEAEQALRRMRSDRVWKDKFNYFRISEGYPVAEAERLADESYREYFAQRAATAGKDVAFQRNPDEYPWKVVTRHGHVVSSHRTKAHAEKARNFSSDKVVKKPLPKNAYMEEIIEGLTEGFWLPNWADAMEEAGEPLPHNIDSDTADTPPEEVERFAELFYRAVSKINGFSLGDFYALSRDKKSQSGKHSPQQFGYYIAMQAQGHGVSWFDEPGHDGPLSMTLRLPDVQGNADMIENGEFEIDLSMDPDRLNFVVWEP